MYVVLTKYACFRSIHNNYSRIEADVAYCLFFGGGAFLMAYSKANLKSSSDKASHCFRPLRIVYVSDECLVLRNSV